MTVSADSSFVRAGRDGATMHALLIGDVRLGAVPAGFHYEALAMARSASERDVGVIHARLRIACRQQLVWASVTIGAGGSLPIARFDRRGMKALVVRGLLIGVTRGARNLLGRAIVRRTLEVSVAIDAVEHAAMNGRLESIGIHRKADLLAINLFAQG